MRDGGRNVKEKMHLILANKQDGNIMCELSEEHIATFPNLIYNKPSSIKERMRTHERV